VRAETGVVQPQPKNETVHVDSDEQPGLGRPILHSSPAHPGSVLYNRDLVTRIVGLWRVFCR